MAIHWGSGGTYSRQKQMRNELIGLVIGSAFLLTGAAFLFNKNVEGSSTTLQQASIAPTVVNSPAAIQTTQLQQPTMLDNTAPTTPALNLATNQATPITETITTAMPNAETVAAPMASTPEQQATPTPETEAAPVAVAPENTGWIYAGQFANNQWHEKALIINDELPVVGQSYPLSWGAVVRTAPPGKNNGGKHSDKKANLPAGEKVEVLQIKKSGNKGHIWLEIKQ